MPSIGEFFAEIGIRQNGDSVDIIARLTKALGDSAKSAGSAQQALAGFSTVLQSSLSGIDLGSFEASFAGAEKVIDRFEKKIELVWDTAEGKLEKPALELKDALDALNIKPSDELISSLKDIQKELGLTTKETAVAVKVLGDLGSVTTKESVSQVLFLQRQIKEIEPGTERVRKNLNELKPHDADKTVGSLGQIGRGLKDVSAWSFEAKVALVGVAYAMEQAFKKSSEQGAALVNFGELTGLDPKTLQQYQYIARQLGISNEEITGSFTGLQKTLTGVRLGQIEAPMGLRQFAAKMGFNAKDLARFEQNPAEMLQALQAYAQKEQDKGLARFNIRSLGVNDKVIGALNQNAFTPAALAAAPVYGEGALKGLANAQAAWSRFGTTVDMAIGGLNAAHGGEIAGELTKIVVAIVPLVNALDSLAKAGHVFEGITLAIKGWTQLFQLATDGIKTMSAALNDLNSGKTDKIESLAKNSAEGIKDALKGFLLNANEGYPSQTAKQKKESIEKFKAQGGSISTGPTTGIGQKIDSFFKDILKPEEKPKLELPKTPAEEKQEQKDAMFLDVLKSVSKLRESLGSESEVTGPKPAEMANPGRAEAKPALKLVIPASPAVSPQAITPPPPPNAGASLSGPNTENYTVNQTINFEHTGNDPARTAASVKAAAVDAHNELLNHAYRTSSAQARGT